MDDSFENIVVNEETKRLQRLHRDGGLLSSGLICKDCDQIRDRTSALVYTSDKKMRVGENSMQMFNSAV
jgi:hypothetical protein